MIWYRHWIEMRGGLCVAGVFLTLLCLLYPLSVHGSADWFEQSGRIASELKVFEPQLRAMDTVRLIPWAVHAWFGAVAAVIVGIFLGGTGIRTNGFQPGHPSIYYTLTLPISRFDLIWTRFASACAAVGVLFAAMLIFDCAVLRIMGRPVPLSEMAISSFLAAFLVVPVLAVFGVLIPLWTEKFSGMLFVLAIGAAFKLAWPPIGSFIGSQGIPWLSLGTVFLVTGVALSASAMLARQQEL